jgi:mercuric ion transport protein
MRFKSRSFQPSGRGVQVLALGGLLGALVASFCCILPMALVSLGISGAWIANFNPILQNPYVKYLILV